MILTKEQINRYLRHIIIPEISGAGQKKLIEAKVHISAFCPDDAAALAFYIAATGIGHIQCSFVNMDGFAQLTDDIKSLNNEVHVEPAVNQTTAANENLQSFEGFFARIAIGKTEDLLHILQNSKASTEAGNNVPFIVARSNGWNAALHVIQNQQQHDDLIYELYNDTDSNAYMSETNREEGNVMTLCLMGALATIEVVKLCIGFGTVLKSQLQFDLLSMSFSKEGIHNDIRMKLGSGENEGTKKYDKIHPHMELSKKKVLIVGAGGLGCPAAYALARVGIGTIGLIDQDEVEISNLNRQILHSTSRIGMAKVESAKLFIQEHNPCVNVVTYGAPLNVENAMDIIKEYDIILDCVDNFPTRYLINDACYFTGRPLVDAAAVQLYGLIMTILPRESACYRCLFPEETMQNKGMSCSEAGVFGPVPGVLGFLQAAEVLKLLLGIGDVLTDRIVYFDAMDVDFDMVLMSKSKNCSLCGENPTINKLVEFKNFCKVDDSE